MDFKSTLQQEEGQSLLEVVFIFPFLFLFIGLLFKMNMAVQMSIVNTQYARIQAYVLTLNSPEYPRIEFRRSPKMFGLGGQDLMVLGVSDPSALTASAGEGEMPAIPQIEKVGRKGTTVKGSDDPGEPKLRTGIRVRNTASICTQMNSNGSTMLDEVSIPSLGSKRWPFGMDVCRYGGSQ